jgi:ATP/maltotriose-dependent transcriptional regulator MalT
MMLDKTEWAVLHEEEALALLIELGDSWSQGEILGMLANAYTGLGKFDQAQEFVERNKAHMHRSLNSPDRVFILRGLGMAARFQGRYEEAAKLIRQTLEIMQASEVPQKQQIAGLLGNLAFVEIELGNYRSAWDLLVESYQLFRELDIPGGIAWNLEALAFLALAAGLPELAARLFGSAEASREFAKQPMLLNDRPIYAKKMAILKESLPPAILGVCWSEGRALSLEEAIATAKRDFSTVDLANLPAAPPADHVPAATSPGKTPTPTSGSLAELTARELEVLRLVARGLTNAQVAQELVLSPLTVNAYLRSIYSKLNVTSRTAAARLALENGLV